jgi:hypothetical protein
MPRTRVLPAAALVAAAVLTAGCTSEQAPQHRQHRRAACSAGFTQADDCGHAHKKKAGPAPDAVCVSRTTGHVVADSHCPDEADRNRGYRWVRPETDPLNA